MPRAPGLAGAAPRRVLTVTVSVGVIALIALIITITAHSSGLHLY